MESKLYTRIMASIILGLTATTIVACSSSGSGGSGAPNKAVAKTGTLPNGNSPGTNSPLISNDNLVQSMAARMDGLNSVILSLNQSMMLWRPPSNQ